MKKKEGRTKETKKKKENFTDFFVLHKGEFEMFWKLKERHQLAEDTGLTVTIKCTKQIVNRFQQSEQLKL